ncbi:MAG TPA: hypothetical protein VK254_02895 [Candidatus Bathyarchaeia archaeon]|nr:hypothetical protein [Candidatus Bathyarchaeia archaeon]
MNKRLIILTTSVVLAILAVWGLTQISWNPAGAYLAYAGLAALFFGVLISNQQYDEDLFPKIERFISAFLFSYIIFFRFLYAPLSQFFFGTLITQPSFFADLLSLVLFAIFFFLFGTTFLVVNAYSRVGFLSNWRLFNNEKMYFVLRGLFLSAVLVFILLYLRNSFFSIKNSAPINKMLPPVTCNWTYIRYPNFLSTGRTVAGKDVCLYNYSQDKYDPKICDLITDGQAKSLCEQYFVLDSEK